MPRKPKPRYRVEAIMFAEDIWKWCICATDGKCHMEALQQIGHHETKATALRAGKRVCREAGRG